MNKFALALAAVTAISAPVLANDGTAKQKEVVIEASQVNRGEVSSRGLASPAGATFATTKQKEMVIKTGGFKRAAVSSRGLASAASANFPATKRKEVVTAWRSDEPTKARTRVSGPR